MQVKDVTQSIESAKDFLLRVQSAQDNRLKTLIVTKGKDGVCYLDYNKEKNLVDQIDVPACLVE